MQEYRQMAWSPIQKAKIECLCQIEQSNRCLACLIIDDMAMDLENLIEEKILRLSPRDFQTLANAYLLDLGYRCLSDIGSEAGGSFTRKGTPDSILVDGNSGKVIFVEATTQKTGRLLKKFQDDIRKCEKKIREIELTQHSPYPIAEIFFFYVGKFKPEDYVTIKGFQAEKDYRITPIGPSELAHNMVQQSALSIISILGSSMFGDCVFPLDDFLRTRASRAIDRDMNLAFVGRGELKVEVINAINENQIVLIKGAPGVGKSRLVFESIKAFPRVVIYKPIDSGSIGYLRAFLKSKTPTVVFVDDIDEAEPIRPLIDLIMQRNNADAKLVCTVRSHAFEKVNQQIPYDVKKRIIEIKLAKRSEMLEIIKGTFPKLNKRTLEYILDCSGNNIRIGLILSKSANENPIGFSGKSVQEVIYSFYLKRVADVLGSDLEKHINAMAMLALCRKIDLDQRQSYREEMEFFGVDDDSLHKCIVFLNEHELIQVKSNRYVLFEGDCPKDCVNPQPSR